MSRAAAERASQWLSYSRAGACRRAKGFGREAGICVQLALDSAIEEWRHDVDLHSAIYKMASINWHKLKGWSIEDYLELVGGKLEDTHILNSFVEEVVEGEDFSVKMVDYLQKILLEARQEGRSTVFRYTNEEAGRGHVVYIKPGKKDLSRVFFFDFVIYEGETDYQYGPVELLRDKNFNEYMKYLFDPKYRLEIIEFSLDPTDAIWMEVPTPEEV